MLHIITTKPTMMESYTILAEEKCCQEKLPKKVFLRRDEI